MAAVAAFVKTPAHSPIKTRLAATIGKQRAQAVYEESLRLVRQRLREVAAAGIAVHWAVAEQEAVAAGCWSDFPALWTGDGTLGQRLHQVYSRLRKQSGRVALIGADCPQLAAAAIVDAATAAATVVGPATDGGFYLLASAQDIAAAQWQAPVYSSARTLQMLLAALADSTVTRLPPLTDIDDIESLRQCIGEFASADEARTLRQLLAAD